MHRAAWWLLAFVGLLGLGLVLGLGPVIGSVAKSKAAQRGIELEFESVHPGWLSARFKGVRVKLEGVPGAAVRLESLEAKATPGLALRSVHAQGGSISVTENLDSLRKQLQQRRAQRPKASGARRSRASGVRFSAEGLQLQWQGDHGRSLRVEGLSLQQQAGTRDVSFERAEMAFGRGALAVRGLQARAVPGPEGPQLAELKVQEAQGRLLVVREAAPAEPPKEHKSGVTAELEEAKETQALAKVGEVGKPAEGKDRPLQADGKELKSAAASTERSGISAASHLAAWPAESEQLWQWIRNGLETFRRGAKRMLSDEARVSIERVQMEMAIAGETLTIGPAPVAVRREAASETQEEAVLLSLAPKIKGGSSLALTLRIPLTEGTTEFHLSGGPVSLATLGVQEGNLGLLEVKSTALRMTTHATLTAEGAMQIEAKGSLSPVNLLHPAVGSEPVRGMDLSWGGKVWLDLPAHRLDVLYANLGVAPLQMGLNLSLEEAQGAVKLELAANIPSTPCQELLEAAPASLLPRLEGMALGGSFSMNSSIGLDSSAPDEATVAWNLATECTVEATPTRVDPERFKRPFRYWVTDKEGEDATRRTGPNTARWTAFAEISPNMETALVVCEDSRFFEHPGYDNKAIGDSIRANLRAGRFVRGASTLSMQLAKNLYLGREKTLSRKLQEAAFTLLLEDKLEKEQILELYLNVVEFGPDIYGIRQAAEHYFKSHPSELSLGQALFLATLLPSPSRERFEEDGKLMTKEARRIKRLMRIAHRIDRISEEELSAGLAEELIFGQPDPNSNRGGFLFDSLYQLGGG